MDYWSGILPSKERRKDIVQISDPDDWIKTVDYSTITQLPYPVLLLYFSLLIDTYFEFII